MVEAIASDSRLMEQIWRYSSWLLPACRQNADRRWKGLEHCCTTRPLSKRYPRLIIGYVPLSYLLVKLIRPISDMRKRIGTVL